MGKITLYIKRGIKYILKEYKQPIVKAEITQKSVTEVFKEKVYVITGGGSGIGFYIAKKLVEEKAKVIITGRNEKKLQEASKMLGKNCDYFVLDVKQIDLFDEFFQSIYKKYSRLDGLINNAGISLHE